ncbi:MAG: hypothetical protein IPK82_33875 [Polyangiaceae bacterium]|nr:hypothetical protein [Polyangiaceae bacterium]
MNIHILVEGERDRQIIEKMLADLQKSHTFKVTKCGGRDAARPIARKILIQYGEPTALLLDSDTTDTERANQQKRDLEDYLRWGIRDIPFTVQQFVPEIEAIFFERPKALKRIWGRGLPEKTIVIGKRVPKETLEDLLKEKHITGTDGMLSMLTDADLSDLRQHPVIKVLREFAEQHGAKEKAPRRRANIKLQPTERARGARPLRG